jgi:sulfur transfer complex TusBCD TusB component (DsrH family)
MAGYLLIESRDPFESNDVPYYCDLARGLAEAGNDVTLYLVQNAVFAARPGARSPALQSLAGTSVKLLADDFSLRERGITDLADGIESAGIETVVDRMEAGDKTIWH